MRHPHERVGTVHGGRRRTALGGVLSALAAAVVLVGLGATTATAHDALLASEPADGEVLAEAPSAIVLTFSADQLDVGTAVEVRAVDGTRWETGAAEVDGAEVRQPLDTGMPGGTYEVRWRSVSSDGHPLSDVFTFEVDTPGSESEGADGAPEAEPAADQPEPEPQPATEPEPAAAAETPAAPPQAESSPVLLVAVVLGLVGLAVTVLVVLRRRAS